MLTVNQAATFCCSLESFACDDNDLKSGGNTGSSNNVAAVASQQFLEERCSRKVAFKCQVLKGQTVRGSASLHKKKILLKGATKHPQKLTILAHFSLEKLQDDSHHSCATAESSCLEIMSNQLGEIQRSHS